MIHSATSINKDEKQLCVYDENKASSLPNLLDEQYYEAPGNNK